MIELVGQVGMDERRKGLSGIIDAGAWYGHADDEGRQQRQNGSAATKMQDTSTEG